MPFLETISGKLLLTFATAMVPVVELRGAIPVGWPPAAAGGGLRRGYYRKSFAGAVCDAAGAPGV